MSHATEPRRAPQRVYANPDAPAIADADRLGYLDGGFDALRPQPVQIAPEREIDHQDGEWATHVGLTRMITSREGATFVRIADDVFVIAVYGGQYLHEDRHLAEMDDAKGFSEHTWNLSVEGGENQSLLLEVREDIFTAMPLARGTFTYMNTVNRHAVTRANGDDVVVLVQVDGFGPAQHEEALARIAEVLAARPDPTMV